MAATRTLTGKEAREALIRGVNELADIVCITMGPKGHNVALDRKWSAPVILHDGVSVARAINPSDPFANMGAQLVKEAASKTADVAGDGTTTATLLAQTIVNEGHKLILQGTNPQTLKTGIERAVSVVVTEIKRHAKTLKDKAETAQIATISAANPQIGQLIAEALEKVGKTGVITVAEGTSLKTEVQYKEGMEFEKGWQSSAFITDQKRMLCEIENPYILFCDFPITATDEIANFLEKFVTTTKSKNIVFITDMVEDKALMTLVLNGKGHRGAINTVAVQAPGIGTKRRELLEDMAILTGGSAAFKENGILLENVPIAALGQCDKIEVDENSTRIIGGKGEQKFITERVEQIKELIAKEKSDFEKQKLHERLAKLTGGVAIIEVGGTTDIEIHDIKERVIDAVSATKAAVEEGIVAGGGVTLLKVRDAITSLIPEGQTESTDEIKGMMLVYNALDKPIQRLLENAGIQKGQDLPVDGKTGINVETGEIVDMFAAGIIDPAKVTRQAVQNAASVAQMILTCGACVTDVPDEKNPQIQEIPLQ